MSEQRDADTRDIMDVDDPQKQFDEYLSDKHDKRCTHAFITLFSRKLDDLANAQDTEAAAALHWESESIVKQINDYFASVAKVLVAMFTHRSFLI